MYSFFSCMKDFFTRYRETRKHYYILPGIFGLIFAFAIVAQVTGTKIDLKSLQANVLQANTQKIVYDADLIMESSTGILSLRIGTSAQNIETLNFSIIGNPSVFIGLNPTSANTSIESNEPGIFLVKVSINNSLEAGDIVTVLNPLLQWESPLTLIDAAFTSSWVIYSLSTKW